MHRLATTKTCEGVNSAFMGHGDNKFQCCSRRYIRLLPVDFRLSAAAAFIFPEMHLSGYRLPYVTPCQASGGNLTWGNQGESLSEVDLEEEEVEEEEA